PRDKLTTITKPACHGITAPRRHRQATAVPLTAVRQPLPPPAARRQTPPPSRSPPDVLHGPAARQRWHVLPATAGAPDPAGGSPRSRRRPDRRYPGWTAAARSGHRS